MGFVGNFLLLVSGNGDPLWTPEQRKTVFNEDNSSSCVEDGGKEGGGEASQSPVLDSSHGNGNEDQRKQFRGRSGRRWRGLERGSLGETASGNQCQDGVPLATGDVGRGWPFEWRRDRNTGSCLKKCFSLNIF